jgi:hypothetical protein
MKEFSTSISKSFAKEIKQAGHQWLMPIIVAT